MKYVYHFDEGNKDMRSLLGGKGANLAEMTKIGLPVPTGFTITTQACNRFLEEEKLWDGFIDEVKEHILKVEQETGKKFSDTNNPLLFSVRSGAVFSMPGMMDTILNLGLNDESVEGLAKLTGNPRFAYDSYRRFIQMFSDVAMGVEKEKFEHELAKMRIKADVRDDAHIPAELLKELIGIYKNIYKNETGSDFPQEPLVQLTYAIKAVFLSWNNSRAVVYRRLSNIADDLGTAVNVQSMVFGNSGDDSGTGVAFSRNPSTGENKLFGEFLINAQGEDVVAGIRTPHTIDKLEEMMPEVYEQFKTIADNLEEHYRDMQDLEFTIENKKLYILQTRSGKRTSVAAFKIAADLYRDGKISKEEAVLRIEPERLDQLLHPTFDERALKEAEIITTGLPASPGAASGRVYFSSEDVIKAHKALEPAILVRQETSPEDIEGMLVAEGILTARGGMTSHAAVVARGMGKCCVAGASEIRVDYESKTIRTKNGDIREGEFISINGSTGKVYKGDIKKVSPELSQDYRTIMELADEIRNIEVRANADTPRDANIALEFGAQGIGLCRTEHMFFQEDRITKVRQMILSDTIEERKEALKKILPLQRQDFKEIYEVMKGKPVTIRLLDPPLHEFLPVKKEDIEELAQIMNLSYEGLRKRIDDLHEVNPMLGHRGCRLAITFPEIYRMQARAIIEAACLVDDNDMVCEIMIPLVGDAKELKIVKDEIIEEINQVLKEQSKEVKYLVGTMIEIPRAALLADEIAKEAEFFSFGTNDMTQMGFGFSRDDSGKFLSEYTEKGILTKSPFEQLDTHGIGKLVEMAARLGRETKPKLKLGVCGEHGGNPHSIQFFHKVGLNYVSCSPFRVPIARLAAAQATILNSKEE